MKKILNKKQSRKIHKLLKQKEVHFALGGMGGIALYKGYEALSRRFPELVAFVDNLISDTDDRTANDSEASAPSDVVI